MPHVGDFVKAKRELAQYSLKKLGDAAGVSDSELLKIENGQRKTPNWEILCRIARALEFHPFEILLVAGYISEEDVDPALRITGIDQLEGDDLKTVQLFIDFMIRTKSQRSS